MTHGNTVFFILKVVGFTGDVVGVRHGSNATLGIDPAKVVLVDALSTKPDAVLEASITQRVDH